MRLDWKSVEIEIYRREQRINACNVFRLIKCIRRDGFEILNQIAAPRNYRQVRDSKDVLSAFGSSVSRHDAVADVNRIRCR